MELDKKKNITLAITQTDKTEHLLSVIRANTRGSASMGYDNSHGKTIIPKNV